MITYKWNFGPLETSPVEGALSNIVKTIHWQFIGTDGTVSARLIGSETFLDINPDSFIEFDALTEDVVEQWVLQSISKTEGCSTDEVLTNFKDIIEKQINQKTNPPTVNLSPPWA